MIEGLGPTGTYPNGKLNDKDDGEIKLAIAADPVKKVVVINFGVPVEWLAMPKDNAIEFANLILESAGELNG